MDSIAGFILAGGRSRRMGSDKCQLVLEGQTFLERIAKRLSAVTTSVTIVGHSEPTSTLNFPTAADVYPEWGALGGVHAALAACSADWALIVACDFPFVTEELFAFLLELRERFDAVAPIQHDAIPQPLCAVYRATVCLERAEQLIKSGERKPVALLQSVETRWVSFAELSTLKGADSFFDNVNTPEDYARASEKGRPGTNDVAMG